MNDAALHSDAAAMNDANLPVSFFYGLIQVFFHQIGYIPRLERMQIDAVLNGQFHWFRHSRSLSLY